VGGATRNAWRRHRQMQSIEDIAGTDGRRAYSLDFIASCDLARDLFDLQRLVAVRDMRRSPGQSRSDGDGRDAMNINDLIVPFSTTLNPAGAAGVAAGPGLATLCTHHEIGLRDGTRTGPTQKRGAKAIPPAAPESRYEVFPHD
jgi:hypothetical protein